MPLLGLTREDLCRCRISFPRPCCLHPARPSGCRAEKGLRADAAQSTLSRRLARAVALPRTGARRHDQAAEPKDVNWSFEGPFGTFNQEQLQRGYKVYHDVCSSCHSMNLMPYRYLGDKAGRSGPSIRTRTTTPTSRPSPRTSRCRTSTRHWRCDQAAGDAGRLLPRPFANDAAARAANGGALPPDLSLLAKAREGGPGYIYSILTGFAGPRPA